MNGSADPRSIGQLLTDLGSDIGKLVRNERELFQAEMTQKARDLAKAGAGFAAGAAMLFAALLILLQAVVLALSKVMDPVWASLLVGVVVAGIGVALFNAAARKAQPSNLEPRRAVRQLNKDRQFVKEQVQ